MSENLKPLQDDELPLRNIGKEFLEPTFYFDADAPQVIAFAKTAVGDAATNLEKAARLFYAVRDGVLHCNIK